jgi:ketosteroid isomerase-like protein
MPAMLTSLRRVLASVVWLFPLMAGPALPAGAGAGTAAQPDDDASVGVRRVLMDQQAAWNRGDLDAFLVGYQKSDATAFAGTGGIVRGWQGLRERYQKGYPDKRAMGALTFSELEITPLCSEAALVLGHWHLEREAGPVGGVFSLVLRRLPEGWRIVADHTSVVRPAEAAKP